MSLEGKIAIVTGGSKGIGKAIALKLSSQGATVIINYANDEKKAMETLKELKNNSTIIKSDVSKVEECEKLVNSVVEKYGGIDILVNNVGYLSSATLDTATEADFDKFYNINVKSTFFFIKFASKFMKPNSKIINTSTSLTNATMVRPDYILYISAKAAVEQITKVAAKDLGRKGISVNTVSPGPTATELFLNNNTEQTINTIKAMSPFNRLGEPEDIANVVSFLVSDESNWVSGQNIKVNGAFVS